MSMSISLIEQAMKGNSRMAMKDRQAPKSKKVEPNEEAIKS